MGQRRRFTPEFKRQAVELLKAGQRPAAEIARELGIPRNRLYKWQKEVAAHGGAFPGSGRQAEPVADSPASSESWRGSPRSETF